MILIIEHVFDYKTFDPH